MIYCCGRKGKDAGWGRRKSQDAIKTSADPTGSSEAEEALQNYSLCSKSSEFLH